MSLTKTELQAALVEMRAALPGRAVTVTIRGNAIAAIDEPGARDAEVSDMGVFPGEVGRFQLCADGPIGMDEGDVGTIVRGGRTERFRIVGITPAYDGYSILHYGDEFSRGRVAL